MNTNQFQNKQTQELAEEIDNFIINDYKSQIDSLKSYISDLEFQIKALKATKRELINRNTALIEYEYENMSLNTEKMELKEKIEKLEQEILSTIQKEKEEKRDVTLKLEYEVNNYRRINDTIKGKIEAAEYIIKLNTIQHNYILKLEKEIDDLKNNNIKNIETLKVQHELHYKHLKKKMIDLIKKSNKELQKENITNIEIHSKFSAMNKDEMLEQLEKQNRQIIQLIKENETKDKKILSLIQENNTFISIDKILKKKNLKFSKLIKNFLEKNEQKENNNSKTNNENENVHLFKATMLQKKSPQSPKLEKAYNNLLNNYNLLKEKLDYITDKEREFQKKYCGIILLYDTALKDLLQDEKIISKKININLNKFLEGDLEKYNKKEKIEIVYLLIKHLLPLIKIQSNEIMKLRNLFNNVDIKFKITSDSTLYSRNQNSNIIKSLYDIKQFASDLNYSLKKEENLKMKSKSIYKTYNNTYNNNNHNNIINLINSKEESKSIKSSFFGLNIDASAIKKKGENKRDKLTNTNNLHKDKFAFSAFNFYRNNSKPRYMGIRLYKKGMLRDELMNKNPPLQRMMFLNDEANKEQKRKNKCVTENNFSN